MQARFLTTLLIAGLLAGCASTPSIPYWQNPQWVNTMATTVKNNVQYPHSAAADNFPTGTAIVTFIYDKGSLLAPQIVQSTGSSVLDAAIIEQIPKIKPPQAEGSDIDTPHTFQMNIGMSPYDTNLFQEIRQILVERIQYPIFAGHNGTGGMVMVEFKYKDGKVFDARILTSSGTPSLDQAVLLELRTATFPKPPDWLRNKTFSFSVPYCFGLLTCANTVAQVRYVPAGESSSQSQPPCAEVGYQYKNGSISNVHLIKSSGDTNFDKRAVAEAADGKLAHPSWRFDRAINDYTVPVCASSLDRASASSNPR